jgi:hypothetical protein
VTTFDFHAVPPGSIIVLRNVEPATVERFAHELLTWFTPKIESVDQMPLVVALDGAASLEVLDEAEMLAAGWIRAT